MIPHSFSHSAVNVFFLTYVVVFFQRRTHCISADVLGCVTLCQPSWGNQSRPRPTYSNRKHLLAFLSSLSVLYSGSRGRWRWPELSYDNIWNSVSFHWFMSAGRFNNILPKLPKRASSNLILMLWCQWWIFLLQETGRCVCMQLLQCCGEGLWSQKLFWTPPGLIFFFLKTKLTNCCSFIVLGGM